MSLLAILDIQHAGRPSHPGDLGAQGREVPLVRRYVDQARGHLEARGVDVVLLTEGEYSERHRAAGDLVRVRQPGRAAYVACHLNAGGGEYGLAVHDRRSTLGQALARSVAWELQAAICPPLSLCRISWTSQEPDSPFPRAWGCIRGIYQGPAQLAGVLVEPAFLDCPAHEILLEEDGLRRIGLGLALGIYAWLVGRSP